MPAGCLHEEMDMGTQENVIKIICEILMKYFDITEEKLEERFWKEPLTGFHFKMTGVDMVYLLFEIEKAFDIKITEDQLEFYGFNTIENAAKCVAERLKGQGPDMKKAAFR